MREQQYVGIDLHRRRSVIVRMNDAGEVSGRVQDRERPDGVVDGGGGGRPQSRGGLRGVLRLVLGRRSAPGRGASVHLVHPLGLHWDTRRVKNDVRDATAQAHRLRQNDLPESWIAPPEVRELRELVATGRYPDVGIRLVMPRTGLCRCRPGGPLLGR